VSIKDLPKHLRPRERLLDQGAENLKDYELLAVLLRTGRAGKSAIDIGKDVLKKHPVAKILDVSEKELRKIRGVDAGKICSVLAALELGKRAMRSYEKRLPVIGSPEEALAQLSGIASLRREHFVVLYLNARNQLVHKETVSVGTLTASLVHPREVFAPALEVRAAAVLLAHNHPSGEMGPSDDDVALTEQLIEAGGLMGIDVVDHLILSRSGYVSLKELGIIS